MLLTKVTLDISHKYVNPEAVARDVLRKRCSENMQQIYRRTTPMPKCDFNKVAKQFLIIYLCYWQLMMAMILKLALKM